MSRQNEWIIADEWRKLVVLCSGVSWDGPFASEKHLAIELSKQTPVLFVDPPLSVVTPLRHPALRASLRSPRLRQLGPNLARLTPLAVPGMSRPILRDAAAWATRRALTRAVGDLGGNVRAVIVASLDDVFGACHEPIRLLWGTDDFASAGKLMNLSTGWLEKREADQLQNADIVAAVSEYLADRWRTKTREVVVIPNGCDIEMYAELLVAPVPTDVNLRQPIVGFVGLLSDRIDLRYLEAVADTGRSLLLVGPRQANFQKDRLDNLIDRCNVQWVGQKPFAELPSYLQIMSAGVVPYSHSRFNQASFPLKMLEYLAAGIASISTDIPAARWLDTDLIEICSSPADMATKVNAALECSVDPATRERRMAFVQRHSWAARAREFAQLLQIDESALPV